jgi:hypothetical protein
MAIEIVDFTIKNCHLYRTYPLEMEVLDGFMGKSWEYMGIASGNLSHNYRKWP